MPAEVDVSPQIASPGTASPMRRVSTGHAWRVLIGLVLLVGVAGQMRVWASDRGLWNDELSIAENLREVSFLGLGGPLHYKQVAPPGWLIGEKALLTILGEDEQILKLPQLLAAVMLLCLTGYAARRVIGRWGSLLAAVLIALSPLVYYYAGELKQYVTEAALGMVILLAVSALGSVALGSETVSRRRVAVVAAVTTIAMAGSYTGLIVLAGAVAGLGVLLALQRRWRTLAVTALAAGPGLSLGVFQVLLRRRFALLTNQYDFFPNGVPPEHASPGDLLRWLPRMWQGLVASPFVWGHPWFVLALVAAGLAALVLRGQRLWAAMITGVLLVAVGAAAVRGLPIADRVALYLVAPIVIAVAAGVDGAVRAALFAIRHRRALPQGGGLAVASCLVALLGGTGLTLAVAPAARGAYAEVTHPRYRDDGRDMLREVSARLRPGDVVLSYYFSARLVKWYGPGDGLPVVGLASLSAPNACQPQTVDAAIAGAKRVWYVRGAPLSTHPTDYTDRVLAELAKRGTIVETSTRWRASLWVLVDLTAGPDRNPPTVAPSTMFSCLTILRVPAPT